MSQDMVVGRVEFASGDAVAGGTAREPGLGATAAPACVATLQDGNQARICERCTAPLTVRQQRFCSAKCRTEAWDALHPRVNVTDIGGYRDAGSITDRLHGLMQDGQWRTIQQMALALHEVAETVAASLRRLKARQRKLGVAQPIEKRRTGSTQAPREYRLVA